MAKTISTKDNKTILFLHGYLASSKTFYNQLSFFGRDFNVFAPDLKGFGDNADMEYPYSLDDYISEVQEYLYKNAIENPIVVAHSFGARIVIKGVATNRLNFDRIVLTGPAGLKPRFSFKKQSRKVWFNFLKTFVDKERLLKYYSKDYLALNSVMRKSFVKIVNEYLDEYPTKIHQKTLIINGDRDTETPLYMTKKLNKSITGSALLVFKGAGHFCFLDKPNKFNMEVREFLLS